MPGDIGLTATEKRAGAGPVTWSLPLEPVLSLCPTVPLLQMLSLGPVLITAPTEASWPPYKVDLIIPSTDEEIEAGGRGKGCVRPEARTPQIQTHACCLLSLNLTWDSFRDPATSLEGSRGCSGKEPGQGQPRMEAGEPRKEPGLCQLQSGAGTPTEKGPVHPQQPPGPAHWVLRPDSGPQPLQPF